MPIYKSHHDKDHATNLTGRKIVDRHLLAFCPVKEEVFGELRKKVVVANWVCLGPW